MAWAFNKILCQALDSRARSAGRRRRSAHSQEFVANRPLEEHEMMQSLSVEMSANSWKVRTRAAQEEGGARGRHSKEIVANRPTEEH